MRFFKKKTMRYVIQMAYKGTEFNGWQRQRNAVGVQNVLEKALKILLKEKILTTGAGRTDTGVHASFYVCHFDTKKTIYQPKDFVKKLNGILPEDISIKLLQPVDEEFHSRYSALKRTYFYFVHFEKNPFLKDFSLFYRYELDLGKMNEASEILKQYTDFASFAKTGSGQKTTICRIYEAYWQECCGRLKFVITADRFLRNMVRAIVGTMLDIGRHKLSLDDFKNLIEKRNRKLASTSAPANGLFLANILYPEKYDKIFIRKKLPVDF